MKLSFRGSTKLTNGKELAERQDIATLRAGKVQEILAGLGVPRAAVKVRIDAANGKPDGIEIRGSRKVILSVKP